MTEINNFSAILMLFYCDHCDHVRFIVSFYRMTKYSIILMLF